MPIGFNRRVPTGKDLNRFGLRLLLVFSPVVVIVAVAAAVDGRYPGAALLGLMAVVMFAAGYRTRGHWTRRS